MEFRRSVYNANGSAHFSSGLQRGMHLSIRCDQLCVFRTVGLRGCWAAAATEVEARLMSSSAILRGLEGGDRGFRCVPPVVDIVRVRGEFTVPPDMVPERGDVVRVALAAG